MIKNTLIIFLMSVLLLAPLWATPKNEPADLVLLNGKIVTLDISKPEAQALAIRNGKITAIGTTIEMNAFISDSTKIIDLKGHLAIPGLIESHGHFSSLGRSLIQLDLSKISNWNEAVKMVETAAIKAKPGEWILGRGWHQEKWTRSPKPNIDGLPLHNSVSRVSPDNPVMLTHASGHSCFANAKAMELAGIKNDTPNPNGGEIVKDKKGNPIGIFRETAIDLLRKELTRSQSKRTPQQVKEFNIKLIKLAEQACLENGITSFHDAGVSFATVDLFKELINNGKLAIRMNLMLSENNQALRKNISRYKFIGMSDNHLTVRCIKRLIDGALGAHGAWLLKPYDSLPSSTGLNTESLDSMKETARIAIENDFQLATHAIGDRGNRETLNIYEEAFNKHPEKKDLRWRIEHAQHLHPSDIPRFGKLGVIAAMQGIHCTSDGPWVFKRLGNKRAKEGAYVWQKLMNTGAVISNGTDVPVENVNPIACFYATVTRKMKDGNVFFGDQKMTRMEALRSYTINGAYASFEENIKGSLSVGKLADITVLSKNILTVPDDEILKTSVRYTIIGGKILYKNTGDTSKQ
jgi:predicted amidohydrolase YtcJ